MAIRTKLVELSATPTKIDYTDSMDRSSSVVIQNLADEGYAYIGNENVSSSNFGLRVPPEGTFDVELAAGENLYAVTNGVDSITVSVMSMDI